MPRDIERRREPRAKTDTTVLIRSLNPFSHLLGIGRVVDRSQNGVAVECSDPITPGTAIKIAGDDQVMFGEARYSRDLQGKYRIASSNPNDGLKDRTRTRVVFRSAHVARSCPISVRAMSPDN